MRYEGKLLVACAALGVGEACAALMPTGALLWPAAFGLAVFLALFGYGLAVPGWRFAVLALIGAGLFFHASLGSEHHFREKPWLRNAPVRRTVSPEAPTLSPSVRIRQNLSRRLGIGLEASPDLAALNRAILLGERKRLPRTTRRLFADAGTIHVFAISGLHVMIIARVLVMLMLAVLIPYRFAGAIALPVLWGYVLVVGAPPSAIRAALMATFYFSAPLFYRKPNALVSWSLTFLLVHAVSPTNIANVGSLLSFSVMLAILVAARLAKDIRSAALQGLIVSVAAWAAGVPIVAHVFGRFTPGAFFANLALIPAATVSVVTGVLGLFASFVSETLAAHLNNLSALFTDIMVGLSHIVVGIPGASLEIRSWSFLDCALWYALLLLIPALILRIRSRRLF